MDRYDPYTDKFLRDTQYDILGANLAEVGTDCISRQAAIDVIDKEQNEIDVSDVSAMYAYSKCKAIIKQLPSAQPEIIRCKDCKYWVPGYITDNDDFIPPKCGEWQQMVGHSSDDYCSLAERREVTE